MEQDGRKIGKNSKHKNKDKVPLVADWGTGEEEWLGEDRQQRIRAP